MSANRLGAVGIAASQAKLNALAEIVGVPVFRVIHQRFEGALKGAVKVGSAVPALAFVQMGVEVSKAGKHETLRQVELRCIGGSGARA